MESSTEETTVSSSGSEDDEPWLALFRGDSIFAEVRVVRSPRPEVLEDVDEC